MATGWNSARAGAWPLSRKVVIAENKLGSPLRYFVLMAIISIIECRKDVFKCSVCGKNLSNLKAERRKFRAVSDDLFPCFGTLEEESPQEPGVNFLCGTWRRALVDFKKTGKRFFHVSKHAISQQSVTICASLASLYFYSSWRENFPAFRTRKEDPKSRAQGVREGPLAYRRKK